VFRMLPGEIWFLDVTQVHGAAALSDQQRVHLIVDFADFTDDEELVDLQQGSRTDTIPPDAVIERPPLSQDERAALHELAGVIDAVNLQEIFGIVAKKHYRRDGGPDFFWSTVDEIARRLVDDALRERIASLRAHFLITRGE
jgi:hypothetical protein